MDNREHFFESFEMRDVSTGAKALKGDVDSDLEEHFPCVLVIFGLGDGI